jgi:hypothetical protein
MLKTLLGLCAVACALLGAPNAHADARFRLLGHGAGFIQSCPYAQYLADCLAAPPYGSFQNQNAYQSTTTRVGPFAPLAQSGQSYNLTPINGAGGAQTQNVAGVQFGVAIPSAAVVVGGISPLAATTTGSSIASGQLDVGALTSGALLPGMEVSGTGIGPNDCHLTTNVSGSGGGSVWNIAGTGCPSGSVGPEAISLSGGLLTVSRSIYGAINLSSYYSVTLDEGHGGVAQGTHVNESLGGGQYVLDKSQAIAGGATFFLDNLRSPDVLQGDSSSGCLPVSGTTPDYGITYNQTGNGPGALCAHTGDVVTLGGLYTSQPFGYDFSPSNRCQDATTGCTDGLATFLKFQNLTSSSVKNSKFVMDAKINSSGSISTNANVSTLILLTGSGPDTWISDYFDGCGRLDYYCSKAFNSYANPWTTGTRPTYSASIFSTSKGGNTTLKYDAIMGVDGRPYARAHTTCNAPTNPGVQSANAASCDIYDSEDDFIEVGLFGVGSPHGEYDLAGVTSSCNNGSAISPCNEVYSEIIKNVVFFTAGDSVTNQDGVYVPANTNGTKTLSGITAGSMSSITAALTATSAGNIPSNDTIVSMTPGDWSTATSITLTTAATTTATGVSFSTNEGVNFTGNTHGTTVVDGITAGALSGLMSHDPIVAGPGIPATTTGVPGDGQTWSGATSLYLSNSATASASISASVYGGAQSGNAVTAPLAPWGSSYNSVVQVDNLLVDGVVFATNLAPLYGAPHCTTPAALGPPCFPTTGTTAIGWTHDFVLNATISNDWLDDTGGFYPFSIDDCGQINCNGGAAGASAVFTAGSATFYASVGPTTYNGGLPIGWFLVDNSANTLLGGPALIVNSASVNQTLSTCSGLGFPGACWAYTTTLPAPASSAGLDTIWYRNANPTFINNRDMTNGAQCNSAFAAGTTNMVNTCGGEYP